MPDAGRYDGPLGVLLAIEVVARLHAAGTRLPIPLEVVGFSDEEGVRFGTGYLGSRAFIGELDAGWLSLRDSGGVTLADALRAAGGDPANLAGAAREAAALAGYLEVHIEQGPLLEDEALPLGIVSAIAGQKRDVVTLRGQAGHAGTVPMRLRHDALAGAAELVLAVERTAHESDGLVATVGHLVARPGASNVIPGDVTLTVDVRHAQDSERRRALEAIRLRAREIAAARGLTVELDTGTGTDTVEMDSGLRAALARAVRDRGLSVRELASGAGHDAAMMSRRTRVAMLFVRCAGGISHHPDESVSLEDVAVALDVLASAVCDIASTSPLHTGAPA